MIFEANGIQQKIEEGELFAFTRVENFQAANQAANKIGLMARVLEIHEFQDGTRAIAGEWIKRYNDPQRTH